MIESIQNSVFTGWMGLYLYWLPLLVCVCGFTVRTIRNYRSDIKRRDVAEKAILEGGSNLGRLNSIYHGSRDNVGSILLRCLVSVIPVVNLGAAIFNIAPNMIAVIFKWFVRVIEQDVVPSRTK